MPSGDHAGNPSEALFRVRRVGTFSSACSSASVPSPTAWPIPAGNDGSDGSLMNRSSSETSSPLTAPSPLTSPRLMSPLLGITIDGFRLYSEIYSASEALTWPSLFTSPNIPPAVRFIRG